MLYALFIFLGGCLALAFVIYVVKLILGQLELGEPIKQIALVILGLMGLVALIMLSVNVFRSGGALPW